MLLPVQFHWEVAAFGPLGDRGGKAPSCRACLQPGLLRGTLFPRQAVVLTGTVVFAVERHRTAGACVVPSLAIAPSARQALLWRVQP